MLGFSSVGETTVAGFTVYTDIIIPPTGPKVMRDGGADFYFTDWMRRISSPTRNPDQEDAYDRYDEYYMREAVGSKVENYNSPGVLVDPTPLGSITRDKDGNVFYSVTLGGEVFNFLTEGDLLKLFPKAGANGQFYPVGLS